ncbi:RNA polymerase sigma factor [Alloprevotella sp. oral taxon 473]|jgi:RNA polymerase sigma factor, sigma-70 family|uniref:RNA polymerase sigma factor n=1 Tax=Alloprevotella sp. oral taxon 473 TaxID=712469 RepID=UPI0002A3FB70|nr:sigma-70 family RNA polymerase sigma factor [Alloprevotella sp. oral taxon 473]EKX88981.1 Sigma-70 region 2 [Alloprevotella sp. oral taxon 473 str. F0040]
MDNYKMMTDQILVGYYMMGCNEAFDCLLERYKDKLFQYIIARVHQEDLANDLFQETFVKVILNLKQGKYTDSGKFYAWITRIAHNLIIDYFRNDSDIRLSPTESNTAQWENMLMTPPDDALEYETLLGRLASLIDLLPQEQQEVVRMRYYQDYSFKEIAAQTGVSINTSLGRMRYALLNLRKIALSQQVIPN